MYMNMPHNVGNIDVQLREDPAFLWQGSHAVMITKQHYRYLFTVWRVVNKTAVALRRIAEIFAIPKLALLGPGFTYHHQASRAQPRWFIRLSPVSSILNLRHTRLLGTQCMRTAGMLRAASCMRHPLAGVAMTSPRVVHLQL